MSHPYRTHCNCLACCVERGNLQRHADPATAPASAVSSDQPKEGSGAAQPVREALLKAEIWEAFKCGQAAMAGESQFNQQSEHVLKRIKFLVPPLPQSAGSSQIEGGPEPVEANTSEPTSALLRLRKYIASITEGNATPEWYIEQIDKIIALSGGSEAEKGNVSSQEDATIPLYHCNKCGYTGPYAKHAICSYMAGAIPQKPLPNVEPGVTRYWPCFCLYPDDTSPETAIHEVVLASDYDALRAAFSSLQKERDRLVERFSSLGELLGDPIGGDYCMIDEAIFETVLECDALRAERDALKGELDDTRTQRDQLRERVIFWRDQSEARESYLQKAEASLREQEELLSWAESQNPKINRGQGPDRRDVWFAFDMDSPIYGTGKTILAAVRALRERVALSSNKSGGSTTV